MSDPLFGWDMTFKTVERDITKKADILVAFTHFKLVKRGFRCIGVGDNRTLAGNETRSELLPNGWNDGQQYSLRYVLDGKLYILNALITDGNLILNLMKADDLSVSSLAFDVEDTVKETSGTIEQLMPAYKEVMHKLKRDLIDTTCDKATSSTETQTRDLPPQPRSLREPPGMPFPMADMPGPAVPRWPHADPFQIGRSDLDPFAPGGGGMIFDPFSPNRGPPINPGLGVPGGLPRGAVPPGARFDPFAPPDFQPGAPRRQPPPDADDFMPPGDMFM